MGLYVERIDLVGVDESAAMDAYETLVQLLFEGLEVARLNMLFHYLILFVEDLGVASIGLEVQDLVECDQRAGVLCN